MGRLLWPFWNPRRKPAGQLKAIYRCSTAGETMQFCSSAELLQHGLKEDRYATHRGHWHQVESCPLTLITEHELQLAAARFSGSFDQGQHRRNLVISGFKAKQLLGKTLAIGEVVIHCDRPRPPCGYLDQVTVKGAARALGKHSGLCASIIKPGRLCVGDKIELIDQTAPE